MKKIIILGGLGHIGSGLIRFLNEKYPFLQVTVIDNLSTGKYYSLFGQSKKIREFIELDVRDSDLINRIKNQDLVIHLAAITRAYDYEDKQKLYEHNLAASLNVLQACSSMNIPLIYLSSTSTYEACSGSVDEDTAPKPPKNLYALSKYHEEEVISNYSNGHVLRLGTIHGISPGMNFHTIVNRFCWKAISSQSIPMWKNSFQTRSAYLSLSDLIKVMEQIILKKVPLRDLKLVNLVSHNSSPLSIYQLIHELIPEANYELIDGIQSRREDLIVMSTNPHVSKLLDKNSIYSDIKQTLGLFSNTEFNWNEYYSTYA